MANDAKITAATTLFIFRLPLLVETVSMGRTGHGHPSSVGCAFRLPIPGTYGFRAAICRKPISSGARRELWWAGRKGIVGCPAKLPASVT